MGAKVAKLRERSPEARNVLKGSPDLVNAWKAEVQVFRNGASVASDDGIVRIEGAVLDFDGSTFDFHLPRGYFEAESASEIDRNNIKLVLFHPEELVEVVISPWEYGAPWKVVRALDRFLAEPRTPRSEDEAIYPPLVAPVPRYPDVWITQLEAFLLVGSISTWFTKGEGHPLLLLLLLGAASCELFRLWKKPLSESAALKFVPSPASFGDIPTKQFSALRGGRRSRSHFMPWIEQVSASLDDPAIVPPPQAKSDLISVGMKGGEGNEPTSQYRYCLKVQSETPGNEKSFAVELWVKGASEGPLEFGETILHDLGLMTIGPSEIAFQGFNTSFRIGRQFLADKSKQPLFSQSVVIPLASSGRHWISVHCEQPGFLDAVVAFRKEASPSSLLSVYPPLSTFVPRHRREFGTRLTLAALVVVALVCGFAGLGLLGIALIITAAGVNRVRAEPPSDPPMLGSFVGSLDGR